MSASEIHPYFTGNGTYKAINPIVSKVGDFTPFYIAITICSVIIAFLLILNIVCCCSRYSKYWLDRHTGNRWIASIWSATPHKQPPLDYTELEIPGETVHYIHTYIDLGIPGETLHYVRAYPSDKYGDIHGHKAELLPSVSQQPLTTQHYSDLHKRESDL